jgi:predicted dehydrogenase
MNWGIIGCGKIAEKFAQDLILVEGQTLYGVASRSLSKAAAFKERHGGVVAYGTYADLCEDDTIDIVYLATPHNSHHNYGLMVMNAGKHLLCEKPLAVNEKQVLGLIECAQQNQVFLMEAMWTRFNPIMQEVKSWVDKHEIGTLRSIHADFCFYKEFEANSRLFNPDLAGGALLDVGIYPIFLSYVLLGAPETISSRVLKHKNGVDLQTSMLLEYKEAHSLLTCSLLYNSEMKATIRGSEGEISIYPRWHESAKAVLVKEGRKEIFEMELLGKGYSYEIMECVQCIGNSQLESKLWSHQDSLTLIKTCDAIRNQGDVVYPFE